MNLYLLRMNLMSLHQGGAELVNDSPVWPEMNAGSIVTKSINERTILNFIVDLLEFFQC